MVSTGLLRILTGEALALVSGCTAAGRGACQWHWDPNRLGRMHAISTLCLVFVKLIIELYDGYFARRWVFRVARAQLVPFEGGKTPQSWQSP